MSNFLKFLTYKPLLFLKLHQSNGSAPAVPIDQSTAVIQQTLLVVPRHQLEPYLKIQKKKNHRQDSY